MNKDGSIHSIDATFKSLFGKPLRKLWENGALKVDPKYQHIIDDFKNLGFWVFKNLDQELHLVSLDDSIVTLLPRLRVSSNSSGEPMGPLWLNTPPQSVVGANYRDQIVPPKGHVYVNLEIDESLVQEAIFGQKGLKHVSPYLQRDALNRVRVQYLYHMIIAAQYLFKLKNITQFQLASNEVRYSIKKEDEETAKEVLNLVDRLVKLAIHADISRISKDDEIEIDDANLISEETPVETDLFKQHGNLLRTQVILEKTRG